LYKGEYDTETMPTCLKVWYSSNTKHVNKIKLTLNTLNFLWPSYKQQYPYKICADHLLNDTEVGMPFIQWQSCSSERWAKVQNNDTSVQVH